MEDDFAWEYQSVDAWDLRGLRLALGAWNNPMASSTH
jgi:hypothetical protein